MYPCTFVILTLRRLRQEACGFDVSLDHTASFKAAYPELYNETVSKKKRREKKRRGKKTIIKSFVTFRIL